MWPKCWGCGKPLELYGERIDGICEACGMDAVPLLELTTEGQFAAACYRAASLVITPTFEKEQESLIEVLLQ